MNQNRSLFSKNFRKPALSEYFMLLLAAYLAVSACNLFRYKGGVEEIEFVRNIHIGRFFFELLLFFVIMLAIRFLMASCKCSAWILLGGAFFFAGACVLNYRNVYFTIGIATILGFFIYHLTCGILSASDKELPGRAAAASGNELPSGVARAPEFKEYRKFFWAVLILSLVMAAVFSLITVCRYRTFCAANFDFGIFCQMYEYMAKTGLPLTTSERGYLLSHFYIHFSPVFYVFLPIYMIFRCPECLLVLQSVMVFAAAIPLFLICRHYRMRPIIAMLVSCIYMAIPAIQQPLFYDFHENKFLPFFFLWFIYFYLEDKKYRALAFLVLSLMVKEETAIFLIIFAFYRMIVEKDIKRGAAVLLISGGYFIMVMAFITMNGQGLMEGHYSMYYLPGESGMFAMAKNILLEPARFVKQVFDEKNFPYIFYTLGVLLFIPLASKDFRRLVLLLPYVAFALMTDYSYQHDVGFQYTYGPGVLVLLLFILNLQRFDAVRQTVICISCISAGLLMSYTYRGTGYIRYIKNYYENREYLMEKDAFLKDFAEKNPQASVMADTFFTAHIASMDELYEYNDKKNETDYVLLSAESEHKFEDEYEERGYVKVDSQYDIDVYRNVNDIPEDPNELTDGT